MRPKFIERPAIVKSEIGLVTVALSESDFVESQKWFEKKAAESVVSDINFCFSELSNLKFNDLGPLKYDAPVSKPLHIYTTLNKLMSDFLSQNFQDTSTRLSFSGNVGKA